METLVAHWGYLAVLLGVLVEGEAVLIAAGALAHRGDLSLPWVIAIAFVSSVIGDQGWFHVGRRFGSTYADRHPRARARLDLVRRWVARYGDLYVVAFRFLYGLRMASPIVLGAMKYSERRFTVLNAVGAALWAIVIGCVGYALGATFTLLLRRAAHFEELALGAVAIAGVLALIVRRRRTQRSEGARLQGRHG